MQRRVKHPTALVQRHGSSLSTVGLNNIEGSISRATVAVMSPYVRGMSGGRKWAAASTAPGGIGDRSVHEVRIAKASWWRKLLICVGASALRDIDVFAAVTEAAALRSAWH